jgi:tol-pal system protein YbgF
MKRLLPIILLALAASSCVQPAQIDVIEREQRRMRSELATMHTDVESIRTSLADTRANLQPMQRDLNAVKERIEEARVQMGKQIGQSSLQGDQRVKSLEARIGKLEEDSKLQADMIKSRDEEIKRLKDALQDAQKTSVNAAAPGDGLAEALQGETDAVRREYEAAWLAFDKKDYKVALTRFREFLKRNPKSKLAANAQYWLAESHYGLREFDQAIIEFDAVRRRYPQSDKAPAALLKQGFAFAELGEKLNARLVLQEVVDKYPQAPEAARARQRLKTLES